MLTRDRILLPAFSALLFVLGAASTSAAKDQPVAPRAARSVHLAYEGRNEVVFYNEMRVERSTPGSYFMAAGFRHGYFGIQEQNQGRKVVIFSVWDPTKGDDAAAVPLEQRVEVLHQGEGVEVKRFGGEGTGGQSFFPYDWKLGDTYRFLVKVKVTGEKTAYSGYFYLPESKSWKHLVTFRTRTGGEHLQGLYSFVEDFRRDGKSPGEARRASFGNGWTQDASGQWKQLTRARFTASGALWEAKDTIDAGVVENTFYLQTGGDTKTSTPLNSSLERKPDESQPPQIP